MTAENRRQPRFALGVACSIRMTGGIRRQTRVIDISEKGARLETFFRVNYDELVWLDLAGFRNLACRATWSSSSFTGLSFCTPMHPSILDSILMNEPPDYTLNSKVLEDISNRADYETSKAATETHIKELQSLKSDCHRAFNINRIVQALNEYDLGIK